MIKRSDNDFLNDNSNGAQKRAALFSTEVKIVRKKIFLLDVLTGDSFSVRSFFVITMNDYFLKIKNGTFWFAFS